jgi:hypothetical protein
MHITLEGLYDPQTGLHFNDEMPTINKPVRVLITILDQYFSTSAIENSENLLQKLQSIHQIPYSPQRSSAEIEHYIQTNRENWD